MVVKLGKTKQDSTICCLQETHIPKDPNLLKVNSSHK